MSIRRTTESY